MRSNRLTSLTAAALGATAILAAAPAHAADKITYQDHILPIFRNACLNCHNASANKAGLDLSTYQKTLQGSSGGEVVYAGELIDSILYQVVMHNEQPKMPPSGDKLPADQLNLIKQWIEGGLLESSGSKAVVVKKKGVSELSLDNVSLGKPDGPPPMPQHLLREPAIHTDKTGAVTSIAASPWAPLIAIAAQKQVLLYNSDTAALEGTLYYPDGWPKTVHFSRNGKLLIAGGGHHAKRGEVVVWNIETGERVMTVGDEYDEALAADLSADQQVIAIGGPSKLIKLYDTASGEPFATIKKHTDWVMSLAFSPDGVLLATGGRAGGLWIWEAHTGREFYTLGGHRGAVTDMAWRADSNILATAGEDGKIILWDMNTGNAVKNWQAHEGGVLAIDFARDGRIVSAGRDKHMRTWDGSGKQLQNYRAMDDIVVACAFTHDGKRVINADWRGNVRMYDTESGAEVPSPTSNPPTIDMRLSALTPLRDAAQARRDEAAAALKQAQDQAAASAAEVARLQPGIDQAKAEVAAAEQAIATAKQEAARLTAALVETQAKRPALEAALTEADQAIAQARGAVESVAIAQAASAKNEAAAKQAVDQATLHAEEAAKAAAAAPDDAALAQAATDAQQAVATAQAAHAAAADQAAQHTQMLEAVRANLAQAMEKKTATTKAIEHLDTVIADQGAALRKANTQVASAEQQHMERTGKLAALSQAIAGPRAKANDDAKAAELAQRVLESAQTAYDTAAREVVFWQAEQVNVQRHAARRTLRSAEDAHANAAAQAAYLAQVRDQAAAALAAVRHELDQAPTVVAEKEKALAVALDNVKQQEQAHAAAMAKAADREALTQTLASAAEKAAAAAEQDQENATLTKALASAREAVSLMQQDVAAQKQGVAEAQAKLTQVQSQVPAAQQAVAQAKAMLESLPAKVAEHEKQLATATGEAQAASQAAGQAAAAEQTARQAFDALHTRYLSALPADAK